MTVPVTHPPVPVPGTLAWLVDEAGEDTVFTFIESLAGQRIWVPAQHIADSQLARLWGHPLAQALAARHGGCYIEIPLCRPWRVRKLLAQGCSHNEICARVGVSRRYVAKHLLRGMPA
ncbi:hypothetical protein E3E12_06110 [Formicincola oecophyllae]|uniref:Helix-turn-helix domain-containing protein n=1 Tax=Formicincola oecophyllae TaxID=2558361 RepID=A0A4Y6U8P8_9PROT|nr:hypothetical protein [Formicincola oecophyllae]QDH13829.1 hypothetical protein E3E12_06110 [Formicincola oecophyllae]